jgi:hypothetical protein
MKRPEDRTATFELCLDTTLQLCSYIQCVDNLSYVKLILAGGQIDMTAGASSCSEARDARPFRLITVYTGVLAQNEEGKLIELGQLLRDDDQGRLERLDIREIETDPQDDERS